MPQKHPKIVRISPEQIFEMTKYAPFAGPKEKPWRPMVEKHFQAEHGCDVIDHTKLKYLMPDDPEKNPYIEIHGLIGESLADPKQ